MPATSEPWDRSRTTTAQAATTLRLPTVTPGPTNARAPTQHSSPMVIGRAIRSKLSERWLCEPVQRKASCERHEFEPIVTGASVRSRVPPPIQTKLPRTSLQGKEMSTPSRITQPFPIFAPKARRRAARNELGSGRGARKKSAFTAIQTASFHAGAPRSIPAW